ncbi:hypothetical protein BCR35DRAFT_298484 [Leucosporidium creatinivorum]|uniref:Uncharacterized protein n=1 Tax=Leucosporidium creatinivorum TaxID=106004 RepID=A0A1Y2G4P8_9BASI|nr:hypothetical protein BCR35DRAFT_298484 [Leucosporidium creatinivorum]
MLISFLWRARARTATLLTLCRTNNLELNDLPRALDALGLVVRVNVLDVGAGAGKSDKAVVEDVRDVEVVGDVGRDDGRDDDGVIPLSDVVASGVLDVRARAGESDEAIVEDVRDVEVVGDVGRDDGRDDDGVVPLSDVVAVLVVNVGSGERASEVEVVQAVSDAEVIGSISSNDRRGDEGGVVALEEGKSVRDGVALSDVVAVLVLDVRAGQGESRKEIVKRVADLDVVKDVGRDDRGGNDGGVVALSDVVRVLVDHVGAGAGESDDDVVEEVGDLDVVEHFRRDDGGDDNSSVVLLGEARLIVAVVVLDVGSGQSESREEVIERVADLDVVEDVGRDDGGGDDGGVVALRGSSRIRVLRNHVGSGTSQRDDEVVEDVGDLNIVEYLGRDDGSHDDGVAVGLTIHVGTKTHGNFGLEVHVKTADELRARRERESRDAGSSKKREQQSLSSEGDHCEKRRKVELEG